MIKDLKVGDKVIFHGCTQTSSGVIQPIYHGAKATVAEYWPDCQNVKLTDIEYASILGHNEDGWVHLIQIEKVIG